MGTRASMVSVISPTAEMSPVDQIVHALAQPTVADWIAAAATALTALVALVALGYANGQIREARRARTLARQLEVERAQPYVVAFTEPSLATNLAIDLVIKNFGATAARDVSISLDPWPMRAGRQDEGARVGIPSSFPILAPGQEWRTSWDWGPDRTESDLPDRHVGEVRFRGIDDAELSSPVVLDLGIYTTREWVEVRGVHDAASALRDIRDAVKRWGEGPRGGLKVYTRDGEAKDEREREWVRERRAQAAAKRAAEAPPSIEPES